MPTRIARRDEPPKSIGALIAAYYSSPSFEGLSTGTKTTYRRLLEQLRADHGTKPVASLEPHHVRALVAAKKATPAQANRLLSLLRLILQFAAESGLRRDNPAREVKKLRYRQNGFRAWTEDEIVAFEARWPIGTRARLAFALLLYTGQRRSDVIRMGRQHVRNGAVEVAQAKTGARLVIPIHPELQAALDGCPSDHLTFLMTEQGRPFATGNAFFNWFTACVAAAGLPKGLGPHGLRKAAARRLAEAGCTTHEIAAVTGHTTLAEVQRYTRTADQQRLAVVAMSRIKGSSEPKP